MVTACSPGEAKAPSTGILLRVLTVRTQNRHGAIFRAEEINEDGSICDTHAEVVARVHANAIGVRVMPGQWWYLRGERSARTFVNASGFEMTEDHIEVAAGGADLRLPDGSHIVDFLARNCRFEGIGPVTAQKLWETFSLGLVKLLDEGNYAALLDAVPPNKAKLLIDEWREEGLSKTLQWLQSHRIGLKIGRRVIDYFGSDAVAKIEENPYRLLSFAAGWSEVDKLAMQTLGINATDERRLAAAVEEVVYRRFSRGDTLVPRSILIDGFKRLFAQDKRAVSLAKLAIDAAEHSRRLLFDQSGNAYSLGASILENRVVDAITSRLSLESVPTNVEAIIKAYEAREGHGFQLNAEQVAAVRMVSQHHFSVITGGAGCGKTTVLKAVCEILDDQGYDVVQLALAGKAVMRMKESTGRPAMTIAAFLSKMNRQEHIPDDMAILIDEASMVDLISFSSLVSRLDPKVKIVLIGDPNQLLPVGPGLVLHCLTGGLVPHVELKVAKRFGSEIANVANSIRDGLFPDLAGTVSVELKEIAKNAMPTLATELYLQSPNDTVVLTATRAMAASINQSVQERISADQPEVLVWNEDFECYESSGLRKGDLVICTANHWDLGLQNGSIGRIMTTNAACDDDTLGAIEWDDGEIRSFDCDLLDSLALAYALTCHKSQGSQWRRVVVCLNSTSWLVDRSLIYTAVTRSQAEIIIIGQRAYIEKRVAAAKAADRRFVALPKRLEAILQSPKCANVG